MQMTNIKDAQHHESSGKPSENRTDVPLHSPQDADNNNTIKRQPLLAEMATHWKSHTLLMGI